MTSRFTSSELQNYFPTMAVSPGPQSKLTLFPKRVLPLGCISMISFQSLNFKTPQPLPITHLSHSLHPISILILPILLFPIAARLIFLRHSFVNGIF